METTLNLKTLNDFLPLTYTIKQKDSFPTWAKHVGSF